MSVITKNVTKFLGDPGQRILNDISLEIPDKKFVALQGPSGSGKSTLLYILSTLDTPTEGIVEINGVNVNDLNQKDLHAFRNKQIGYVFQFHYLLPELTAFENILMPCRKNVIDSNEKKYANDLCDMLGFSHRKNNLPRQMSGGEQQRVAIARALMMKPVILYADEPTGNLDSKNTNNVFELLQRINRELGMTIIMVTHDRSLTEKTDHVIELKDGQVVGESIRNR